MCQILYGKLPKSFYDRFVKINAVQNYCTRQTQSLVCFKPRINKTIGKELILHRGSNLWKEIETQLKTAAGFLVESIIKTF